jgi:23S rRNA (adenine-N6)-dimethyltransferase
VAGRSRRARASQHDRGQHFLGSPVLAARLVQDAGIGAEDRVVEFGAGRGVLTEALARQGAHVLGVELDPSMIAGLIQRFAATPTVTVLHGDATEITLPATPYRVVSNPPFHHTAALLRRILDPKGGLVRGDVVVQWQVARARARSSAGGPFDLLGATWAPWWHFVRGRRLPAALFRPPPAVDAAVLVITRRDPPLLTPASHEAYRSWLRLAFRVGLPATMETAVGRRQVENLRLALGVTPKTELAALRADQWARLFRASNRSAWGPA